ncbi:hypothetical protein OBV_20560 [Oscillibacter valericigenes Sjm18-20]|nr:hypothetical protein OBV_20560 [Oscillibacter valericigenes Sjm18-20]
MPRRPMLRPKSTGSAFCGRRRMTVTLSARVMLAAAGFSFPSLALNEAGVSALFCRVSAVRVRSP